MAEEPAVIEVVPIPGAEVATTPPKRRRKAVAKPEPQSKQSQYVVQLQRIVETADGETIEVWEDFGVITGHSGGDACRKAHNGRVGLPEGVYRYRAFPARSDTQLAATVEVKPVSLFAVTNGAAPR